jgi:uncharacterized protein (DUF2141 family)
LSIGAEPSDKAVQPDSALAKDKTVLMPPKALILLVKNLKSTSAPVVVAIYQSQKNFPYIEGKIREYRFMPKGKVLRAKITDLDYGVYAISFYQDTNLSGKFDKNIFGLPKEAYAFSNNFKPKLKVPSFDDCKFTYDVTNFTVITDLIH